MIGFVDWLLGRTPAADAEHDRAETETTELDQRRAEAERHAVEARAYRRTAERIGPVLRAELEDNHFGERIRYALHQEGWTP
jgi:hypothetical protein